MTGEAIGDGLPVREEVDVDIAPREHACEQCGSRMAQSDIFCGECGFVSRSITEAFSISAYSGQTRSISLEELDSPPEDRGTIMPAAAELPGPPELSEPPHIAEETPREYARSQPRHEPQPAPAPIRHFETPDDDEEDLEATRIVSRLAGNRFVLQFSTGESVTVHGSGLIGRNPRPEPGEFFDHLVRILDAGKSVSKTHLEFGQEGGAFWIKDRFSGNGTVIKEPDISARRAEADRRYRVVRGTRIDIGEQFFVIS